MSGKVIKDKTTMCSRDQHDGEVYGHIWEHGYPVGRFNPEAGFHF